MPIRPTEGSEYKCEDCRLLCDHIRRLDEWVNKWSDIISKIPGLCRAVDEIKEWIKTWPENHMAFARDEIEKDETWKANMETKLNDVQGQLQKDLWNSERNLLTRFNVILGGVIVSCLGIVVMAAFQIISYYAGKGQ